MYAGIENRLLLQRRFSDWRDFVEHSRSRDRKADFFFEFHLLQRVFKAWKWAARMASDERRQRILERERVNIPDIFRMLRDRAFPCPQKIMELKETAADAFNARATKRAIIRAWRRQAVVSAQERRLSDLERQRNDARAKVDEFIESLKMMRKNLHYEMDNHAGSSQAKSRHRLA